MRFVGGPLLGLIACGADDPDVRVKDDTLFFKQTLTFFDRGYTSDRGPYAPTPRWIRYPQYGTGQPAERAEELLYHP